MYRGHEQTRTGSKNMLQRPAREIVTNPLSMYSRPRQSLVHQPSPDRHRRPDLLDMDPYQAQAMLDADDDSNDQASNMSSNASRSPSPQPILESPVSFEDKPIETEKFSVIDPIGAEPIQAPETSRPASTAPPVHALVTALPGNEDLKPAEPSRAQTLKETQQLHSAEDRPTAVTGSEDPKKAKKRFPFTASLFEHKDKEKSTSTFLKKKSRRSTVSFTKSTHDVNDQTNESSGHDEKDGQLVANQSDTEGNNDAFPSNPGVRPLNSSSTNSVYSHSRNASKRSLSSDDIASNNTGKGETSHPTPLSIPSRPVYSRCACCGKIKRPPGNGSGLSPVFENENIRTNFSFEAERSRLGHGKQLSTETRRSIPIIPMEIREGDDETGSIRTVQASIAPYDPSMRSSSRMSGSEEASMSGGIGRRLRSDSASESNVTRFSSLHGKKLLDDVGSQANEDDREVIEDSAPVVNPSRKGKERQETQPGPSRPQSQISSHVRPDSVLSSQHEEEATKIAPVKTTLKPYDHRKSMPKQDVINVVGWSNGQRVDEKGSPVDYTQPQSDSEAVEPDDPLPTDVTPTLTAKEMLKDEKKKSRVSGLLKALQPRPKSIARTLDEEAEEAKASRRSMKRMSMASSNEEALDTVLKRQQIPAAEKEVGPTKTRKRFSMASENKSRDKLEAASKGSPDDASEAKKLEKAPSLTLNLDGTDGGLMSLPTPNLGLDFASSDSSLQDLLLTNVAAETEMDKRQGKMVAVGV